MTENTDGKSKKRRARRDTIQDAPAPTPARWVTRDSVAGVLAETVQVWAAPPRRVPIALDDGTVHVRWAGDHVATWSLHTAGQEIRNAVPATDLECVCDGRPNEVEAAIVSAGSLAS